MLIEFRIQMDENGGVNVVQAQATPLPNSQPKQLGAAFAQNPTATVPAAAGKPGGDAPIITDTGAGKPPTGVAAHAGSGMMFVIGPIVLCGSGPGHTGAGGDAPIGDIGTGKPNVDAQAAAKDKNPPAAEAQYPPKRRQPRKPR
jgi:hypothetical protein